MNDRLNTLRLEFCFKYTLDINTRQATLISRQFENLFPVPYYVSEVEDKEDAIFFFFHVQKILQFGAFLIK